MATLQNPRASLSLSAAGPSNPVPLGLDAVPRSLPPSVLCKTSPGATLAYTIEVAGEDNPDTATWYPLDPSSVGLTASQNAVLGGLVTFVRVNVTSYTSGTLTFVVVR